MNILWIVLTTFLYAGYDSAEVKQEVNKHLLEIKSCHSSALGFATAPLKGKIVLNWAVNSKGKVIKAAIDAEQTTLKDEKLHQCLVNKLKTWKFKPAPKGRTVYLTYPFLFSDTDVSK